jgi:hypothetical protein
MAMLPSPIARPIQKLRWRFAICESREYPYQDAGKSLVGCILLNDRGARGWLYQRRLYPERGARNYLVRAMLRSNYICYLR